MEKCGPFDDLMIQETPEATLVGRHEKGKLSWSETALQISQESEDWNDFDITSADGLNGDP